MAEFTRRHALIATAAAASFSEITETDPHLAWLEHWRELEQSIGRGLDEWPHPTDLEALQREASDLAYLIAQTPPKTPAGAAAQLRLLYEDSNQMADSGGAHDGEIVASALAFLEQAQAVALR